jgi:cation diffusion facilitator CzcD-associated flavoprotein CzcO
MSTASEQPASAAQAEHVDVLIVGAGLSGIGAACRLEAEAPGTSYTILEARGVSGGTWELFKFPGVRSDSDMFTLGYPFRPWDESRAIVDGADILRYLRDTATEYGVDKRINYQRRVLGARWSSDDARWTVSVENVETGERSEQTCGFLYVCSGYFRYDEGYTPDWPGLSSFAGPVVHPQFWPADLDLTGKKVVLIGSGATAATILPAITGTASQVTMLQRSPSYVMTMPKNDPTVVLLRKLLPAKRAYQASRWKNAYMAMTIYKYCVKHPARTKRWFMKLAARQLPEGYDVDTHFNPSYFPWDQRVCLVPDGDFFAAIKTGGAEVVTDNIEEFTPTGIKLRSGKELEADVVITATGLNLLPLGSIELTVDGEPVTIGERVAYKGMMLDGVPNMAFALGYTNNSWTLKVDLVAKYVVRVLTFMRERKYAVVTPKLPADGVTTSPYIEMSSGYFERSRHLLPRQGEDAPWRIRQEYFKDVALYKGPIDTEALEFKSAPAVVAAAS